VIALVVVVYGLYTWMRERAAAFRTASWRRRPGVTALKILGVRGSRVQ